MIFHPPSSFRFLSLSLLASLAVTMVACGGATEDDTGSTAGSGAGSGGAAGSVGQAGSSGAQAAAGSSGSPGSSGSAGSAGASMPVDTSCAPQKLALTGTLGGSPLAVGMTGQGISYWTHGKGWGAEAGVSPATILLWGDGTFAENGVSQGSAIFQARWEGGDQAFYCSTDAKMTSQKGSEPTGGGKHTLSLASLSKIGACPGTPVAGSISGCFGGSCGSSPEFVGSVEGVDVDASSLVHEGSEGQGEINGMPLPKAVEINFGTQGLIEMQVDAGKASGFVVIPGQGGAGPTVYCVGQASTITVNDNNTSYKVTGLSRVGSCPGTPIDGAIEGCIDE